MEETINETTSTSFGIMERHVQTIITALLTAGVIWLISSTSDTNSTVKLINQELQHVKKQIEKQEQKEERFSTEFVSRKEFDAEIQLLKFKANIK